MGAARDLQRHPIDRDDIAEPLGDADELDIGGIYDLLWSRQAAATYPRLVGAVEEGW